MMLLLLSLLVGLPLNAQTIAKSEWLEGMQTIMPTFVCASETPFRRCFEVSAERCEAVIASAMRVCLDRYSRDIPDRLQQPEDGQYWGSLVGECAGESYAVVLEDTFISSAACNDPETWTEF